MHFVSIDILVSVVPELLLLLKIIQSCNSCSLFCTEAPPCNIKKMRKEDETMGFEIQKCKNQNHRNDVFPITPFGTKGSFARIQKLVFSL